MQKRRKEIAEFSEDSSASNFVSNFAVESLKLLFPYPEFPWVYPQVGSVFAFCRAKVIFSSPPYFRQKWQHAFDLRKIHENAPSRIFKAVGHTSNFACAEPNAN